MTKTANTAREITGVLKQTNRLPSSRNGNPRYEVEIGGILARTGVDASLGYSITNHVGREVIATVRMIRGYMTVEHVTNA